MKFKKASDMFILKEQDNKWGIVDKKTNELIKGSDGKEMIFANINDASAEMQRVFAALVKAEENKDQENKDPENKDDDNKDDDNKDDDNKDDDNKDDDNKDDDNKDPEKKDEVVLESGVIVTPQESADVEDAEGKKEEIVLVKIENPNTGKEIIIAEPDEKEEVKKDIYQAVADANELSDDASEVANNLEKEIGDIDVEEADFVKTASKSQLNSFANSFFVVKTKSGIKAFKTKHLFPEQLLNRIASNLDNFSDKVELLEEMINTHKTKKIATLIRRANFIKAENIGGKPDIAIDNADKNTKPEDKDSGTSRINNYYSKLPKKSENRGTPDNGLKDKGGIDKNKAPEGKAPEGTLSEDKKSLAKQAKALTAAIAELEKTKLDIEALKKENAELKAMELNIQKKKAADEQNDLIEKIIKLQNIEDPIEKDALVKKYIKYTIDQLKAIEDVLSNTPETMADDEQQKILDEQAMADDDISNKKVASVILNPGSEEEDWAQKIIDLDDHNHII